MAQYLAKSQQDNMMYGMMPNNGDTFDNSFDDNGLYASRRSAGSFRRGYKMIKHYSRIIYVCAPIYIKVSLFYESL